MSNDPNSTRPADDPVERPQGGTGSEREADLKTPLRRGARGAARERNCPPEEPPRAPLCITIYPFHGPSEGVDVTDALVDAITHVLWKLHGGNEPVNRVEAVILLERAMEPPRGQRSSTPNLSGATEPLSREPQPGTISLRQ